ncbi:MAG: ABC transporter ATP-binding protein [Bacteroidetes bacterium GWA2_32_17]|nr:MAG: ABC transporter ATP-binding protein [Bacteroidetes bacterium GWA2_32_17]
MNIFESKDIVKQYSNFIALDKVSVSIKEGSVFGILGPNGAGKTSFIRIMNQITAPDEGKLYYKGQSLLASHISEFGYLPEERGLYKKMKVGEQVLYLAMLRGLKRAEALKKLKYWFEKFEIQAWWGKKAEELSKGMQQKIQFIISVLHEPKFLIFDEPFSGFDPINVNILKQEILKMKDNGATIILSTHNMASVEELCDDIVLINKAKTVLSGSVNEIRKQYKDNTFTVTFSGFVNLIEASLRHQYQILSHDEKESLHIIKFKLLDNSVTTNMLLTGLLPIGNIVSFNEILPTMNDIFIKVVEGAFNNVVPNDTRN